jgi:hypothetical protein
MKPVCNMATRRFTRSGQSGVTSVVAAQSEELTFGNGLVVDDRKE